MEPASGAVLSAEEILTALETLAVARNLPLPADTVLDLDLAIMGEWPADLFRKAFRGIWENYRYRRFPGAADFKALIAADLAIHAEAQARHRRQTRSGLEKDQKPVWPPPPDLAERQRVGKRFGELARELAQLALSLENGFHHDTMITL